MLGRVIWDFALRRIVVQSTSLTPSLLKAFCSSPHHRALQTSVSPGVTSALQDLVTTGRLQADTSQQFAASVLNALQSSIRQHNQAPQPQQPVPVADKGSEQSLQQAPDSLAPAALPYPRGAYLWGTIGSGKTMLLDLFCSSLPDSDQQQLGLCRLHFHEFMLTVHSRLHSLQQSVPRIKGQSQFGLPVYRSVMLVQIWSVACHSSHCMHTAQTQIGIMLGILAKACSTGVCGKSFSHADMHPCKDILWTWLPQTLQEIPKCYV